MASSVFASSFKTTSKTSVETAATSFALPANDCCGCARQRWQRRCGVSLEFFTGATDLERKVNIDGQEFYDTKGLAFADRSQGLFEVEFGLSYFHRRGCHVGEIGFDLELGLDTEEIRDLVQNQFVHKHITDTPFVPKVDRPSRFKSDLSVYYMVHF